MGVPGTVVCSEGAPGDVSASPAFDGLAGSTTAGPWPALWLEGGALGADVAIGRGMVPGARGAVDAGVVVP
jgi:hypothetical protein